MPGLVSGGAGAPLEKHSEGTLTADGTEQTVAEITTLADFEGWIDLANMASGDTITIKVYVKVKTEGTYRLYNSASYSGAQTNPALHFIRLPAMYGLKVTLQQTAGINRDYYYNFFRRR